MIYLLSGRPVPEGPMQAERGRKLLSAALLTAGAVLLGLGGREIFLSEYGQRQARDSFENDAARPSPFSGIRHGASIARLSIPRLDAQWYVVEGEDPEDLRRGPGHVSSSALPGNNGNCVIAGHRDTHFRALKDIRTGDRILVEASGRQYRYRVRRTRIVDPDDTSPLLASAKPELTLITCYPFYYAGPAPRRYIVEARFDPVVR